MLAGVLIAPTGGCSQEPRISLSKLREGEVHELVGDRQVSVFKLTEFTGDVDTTYLLGSLRAEEEKSGAAACLEFAELQGLRVYLGGRVAHSDACWTMVVAVQPRQFGGVSFAETTASRFEVTDWRFFLDDDEALVWKDLEALAIPAGTQVVHVRLHLDMAVSLFEEVVESLAKQSVTTVLVTGYSVGPMKNFLRD